MTGLEMRDLCAHLNITISSTPAEAACCNVISEWNQATVDNIFLSMLRDFPGHDTEEERNLLLSWACAVKNSSDNVNSFSPNQLVLGRNPNLPSIINENPRSLQGTTELEALRKHLNALQAA